MTLFSIQVTCREHEAELAAADPTSDAQQQRVRQLYHRQLLVPLADAAQTLQSYHEWEAQLPGAAQPAHTPDHVEKGFKKAQQAVDARSEHEAMVASDKPADETLLAAFLAYIKYEQVHKLDCFAWSGLQGQLRMVLCHKREVFNFQQGVMYSRSSVSRSLFR